VFIAQFGLTSLNLMINFLFVRSRKIFYPYELKY
jgi:hypothetical protein